MGARPGLQETLRRRRPEAGGEGTAEGAGLFLNSASARRLALRFLRVVYSIFLFLRRSPPLRVRARRGGFWVKAWPGRQAWPPGGVRELTGGGWVLPGPSVAFPGCHGSGAEALTRQDIPLRVSSLSQVVVSLEAKTQNDRPSLVL